MVAHGRTLRGGPGVAIVRAARVRRSGEPVHWVAEAGGDHDHVACPRVELTAGEALGDRDRLGVVVDQAGPADVSAHDADQPIAELLAVHEQLVAVARAGRRVRCRTPSTSGRARRPGTDGGDRAG